MTPVAKLPGLTPLGKEEKFGFRHLCPELGGYCTLFHDRFSERFFVVIVVVFFLFVFFVFGGGAYPRHMEVPRLGVKLEL